MDKLDELITYLKDNSVIFRPRNEDIYWNFLECTNIYESLNSEMRIEFQNKINEYIGNKLLSFSAFLSEYAIHTDNSKFIRSALLLHSMEDFQSDYRNNYRYIILIDYACKILKISIANLINEVIKVSSERAQDYWNGFLKRDKSLNELNKFKVELIYNDGYPNFKSK
jgi:hypothetical protein